MVDTLDEGERQVRWRVAIEDDPGLAQRWCEWIDGGQSGPEPVPQDCDEEPVIVKSDDNRRHFREGL